MPGELRGREAILETGTEDDVGLEDPGIRMSIRPPTGVNG